MTREGSRGGFRAAAQTEDTPLSVFLILRTTGREYVANFSLLEPDTRSKHLLLLLLLLLLRFLFQPRKEKSSFRFSSRVFDFSLFLSPRLLSVYKIEGFFLRKGYSKNVRVRGNISTAKERQDSPIRLHLQN